MTEPCAITVERVEAPIGRIAVALDGEAVLGVTFDGERERPFAWLERRWPAAEVRERPAASTVTSLLARYFQDARVDFDTLDLRPEGSPFEMRVWAALRDIPCGEVVSYGWVARRIGEPEAAQAVGRANGRNPIPIIIPCHRVIGMDGSLTGFGGGVARKEWLLDHERGGRLL